MHIHFVDLHAQYLRYKTEIDTAIANVIKDTAFIGGNNFYVDTFEKEFASHMGVEYCISCANGTDSIEILLQAMGIGSGDEVIVPALSWISTSEAVSTVGAKPVFVDIDLQFFTIDVNKIEEKITPRTKAIIPVHLYGLSADMDSIMSLARKHNLRVIEDCAQAHDAEYKGQKVGTFGDCASFSFYPGKNLGAYGDAGSMTTNNRDIARVARRIANHGQEGKHNHLSEGRNSRLDGIQGAILSAKLPYLSQWTNERRQVAEWYSTYAKKLNLRNVVLPSEPTESKHVFHLYVVRVDNQKYYMDMLKQHGIPTAIHYPTPLPLLKCYASLGFSMQDFPVAHTACTSILSLPIYPEMTEEMVEYVVQNLARL
jgi:dTDP-4-amino-4,6-dideoxygalactose transaminase